MSGEIVLVAGMVMNNAPDGSFIVEFKDGARICVTANNIRRLPKEGDSPREPSHIRACTTVQCAKKASAHDMRRRFFRGDYGYSDVFDVIVQCVHPD